LNIFANFFSMFLNTDPLTSFKEKSDVSESLIHERLSSMERVFYAYNDDDDQVPFELASDNVGSYNDIDYEDDFFTISPICHGVNIDGTPMADCSSDINGNPFGVTSPDLFEDISMDIDTSIDMFEDDDIGCNDMFSDDTY